VGKRRWRESKPQVLFFGLSIVEDFRGMGMGVSIREGWVYVRFPDLFSLSDKYSMGSGDVVDCAVVWWTYPLT
jgi:hypothetical protein